MFSRNTHQTVHLICLLLAAFLMPLSVWLLSVVSIVMSANWLIGGEYRRKINTLRTHPGIMALLALFAMYLLWLLNTSNFHGALAELRLKLPLLFFPVVAGSAEKPDRSLLRMVLFSFIAGCLFATIAGFGALTGVLPAEIRSSRDLALFVPSIRLSIFLSFAIFSSVWLIMSDGKDDGRPASDGTQSPLWWQNLTGWLIPLQGSKVYGVLLAAAAAAMSYFLFRLFSVTGLVIFVLLLFLTGIFMVTAGRCVRAGISVMPGVSWSTARSAGRCVRAGISFLAAAAVGTAALTILSCNAWNRLHNPADASVNRERQLTLSGRAYTHYPEETLIENGYLVWVNVCEEELRQEWNQRSLKAYDGSDAAGNELRVTLIRYVTAMGMPKDSVAIAALSGMDIFNIEQGYANPLYARKGSPIARAYEIAWEIDRAAEGANPSGHSLTQRPQFYRAAAGIISRHPWTGVGTGDIARAFSDEYQSISTPLKPEYRLRAHNQYLTFGVTFGIPGMIVAVALMVMPWLISRRRFSYPFLIFMTVVLVTMFNDDTFSSFTGAAFFSYFYTLLIVTSDGNETQQ